MQWNQQNQQNKNNNNNNNKKNKQKKKQPQNNAGKKPIEELMEKLMDKNDEESAVVVENDKVENGDEKNDFSEGDLKDLKQEI